MENNSSIPDWVVARHAIKIYLNDKSGEAMEWLNSRPKNIHVTSAYCFMTFFDAVISFENGKINDSINYLKKIEQECQEESGWFRSVKSKLMPNPKKNTSLEVSIYERIVLADTLICQSFLNFLQSDMTSCLKGGWMLRRAWKIYQETYDQLMVISKKYIERSDSQDPPLLPSDSMAEDLKVSSSALVLDDEDTDAAESSTTQRKNLYSFPSKTVSDFSYFESSSSSGIVSKPSARKTERPSTSNYVKKSISDHFNSPTDESDTMSAAKNLSKPSSQPKLPKVVDMDAEKSSSQLDLATLSRLLSAVCFGYGLLRLMVSLAPNRYMRWANVFGFKGDRNIALKCLAFSRAGEDMRAPLSSIALLWYHTVVRPFCAIDGMTVGAGINDAKEILNDSNEEYAESSLFLFFKGRMERLKPDVPAAIEAYNLSVAHATQNEIRMLGLHEVGWCRLMRLEFPQASLCFEELQNLSRWSRGFYAYMTSICHSADTGHGPNGQEILNHLDNKHQIEKYIRHRVQKFPSEKFTPHWAKFMPDGTPWALYCFEMLYLWNTLPSCAHEDLHRMVALCTPSKDMKVIKNEPMIGLSLLLRGASLICISDSVQLQANHENRSGSTAQRPCTKPSHDIEMYTQQAVEALRACIELRSECSSTEINRELSNGSNDNISDDHISAFAKYELGMILLRTTKTRAEGKATLSSILTEFKDYDFETRLNVRISSTLRSVERYEARKRRESR